MKNNWRDGNDLTLLINGEEFFPRVFESLRNAQTEILLETFIIKEDPIGQTLQRELIAAAQRGVKVDITIDGYGSGDLSEGFTAALMAAGVRLHIFNPQPKRWGVHLNVFRRLHRKLIVIDQKLAFIGGINFCFDHISNSGPDAKQDYAVAVQGPVVADIHQTCMHLLVTAAGYNEKNNPIQHTTTTESPAAGSLLAIAAGSVRAIVVQRDNAQHRRDIERQYLLAARTAQKRLVIANAYFFPGYRLLRELRRAARRKVEVILILQGQSDVPLACALSRLLYNYLLRADITIYEYCKRQFHGKVAVMDEHWATIGSSNLDPLSLSLNLEANLVIEDEAFNQQLYQNLITLAEHSCEKLTLKNTLRGLWWRAPLIFLSFHFLRKFPTILGWLPGHAHHLQLATRAEPNP